MKMSPQARLYWIFWIVVGLAIVGVAFSLWHPRDENLWKLALYLGTAIAASGLKITLPEVFGTLSLNYLFIVVGLLELQLGSVVCIGVCGVLAQTLIRPREKPVREQVLFSAFSVPAPILAAWGVLKVPQIVALDPTRCLALGSASLVYFLVNTGIVAGMISLTTGRPAFLVWRENLIWTSPQYLAGGAIAGAIHLMNRIVPWQGLLLSGPPLYLVYRSYTLYRGRVEEQQKHIAQMAELHWRTIEALALAIEAKDDTTAAHLKRVQVYAVELARELNLSPAELKAVEAAALLHDIGKLAVPEYIISKPGKLTPEEFEKMKIHPIVGAEILERVCFPYPVVPIVRSHHEKFDGSGYPDGLAGEAIPIGARILSAVDCLDALASDRQYRPAMPLEKAMEFVASEAGKSFDPRIVAILGRRHQELEWKAKLDSGDGGGKRLPGGVRAERCATPAAGLARDGQPVPPVPAGNFTLAIANARREVQLLVEITNDLGNSLGLDETLALLAVRLGNMVPHDAIVIFIRQNDKLIPQFVKGESFRLFSALEIPVGQGLSGWVAENDLPILNGNPAVEPGYLNDPQKITSLRSAISVPLNGQDNVVAVVSLYRLKPDAFNQDHLRMLLAIRCKAGLAIENSLRFRRAKHAAEKDELTGLLNAGSAFRLLEEAIRDAARRESTLAVILLDLDGFKQANDVHGHLAGNRVLQEISRGLLECCRSSDHVARMGGDEFVLVLPDANPESISGIMLRIHDLGPEAGMRVCGEKLISISAGVAMYPRDGRDAERLLELADQLMYDAKKESKRRRAGLRLANAVVKPVASEATAGGPG